MTAKRNRPPSYVYLKFTISVVLRAMVDCLQTGNTSPEYRQGVLETAVTAIRGVARRTTEVADVREMLEKFVNGLNERTTLSSSAHLAMLNTVCERCL